MPTITQQDAFLNAWQTATIQRWKTLQSFNLENLHNPFMLDARKSAMDKSEAELTRAGYSEEIADLLVKSTLNLMRKEQYENRLKTP